MTKYQINEKMSILALNFRFALKFFKSINFSIWSYVKKGDGSELCFIEGVNGFYMSYFTSCLTLCPKCIGLFSAVHVLLS